MTSKVPLRDSAGRVIGLVGIGHDITERKQAEDMLRHSQEDTAHANNLLLALSRAAQAVQLSRTTEEIYSTIQDQVSQMGYYATGFELSEIGRGLRIADLNYKADLVRKAEKATGLSLHNFRFRPRADSIFQKVLGNGETVFVKHRTGRCRCPAEETSHSGAAGGGPVQTGPINFYPAYIRR